MKVNKLYFYNLVSYATLIVIAICAFWLVYPYKPLVFNTNPAQVTQKIVKGGDHLQIEVDYCKNTDKMAVSTVTFIDGVVYSTTPIITNMVPGCHKVLLSVYVPKALPAGEMHIKNVFRYDMNPLRHVDVELRTESFTIVK